jgi:hypothetical protein
MIKFNNELPQNIYNEKEELINYISGLKRKMYDEFMSIIDKVEAEAKLKVLQNRLVEIISNGYSYIDENNGGNLELNLTNGTNLYITLNEIASVEDLDGELILTTKDNKTYKITQNAMSTIESASIYGGSNG